jgi:citrate lyase subunit beta/citryl-CoA lyase
VSNPWRSVLFVPGNRPELAEKAGRSGASLVVLDLEDAVPPQDKLEARSLVNDAAGTLRDVIPVAVRVNAPGTDWFKDDVAALPEDLLAVVIPKVESATQRDEISRVVPGRPVMAGLETVRGVADAREILREPIIACYFGAEDYVVDLGGVRSAGNEEVVWARSWVAVCARLAGVAALDIVTLHYRDADRFVREATEARALGYAGKLCIHPSQVRLANGAFGSSPSEVEWAQRVLAAFEKTGGMTIGLEGEMVDEVVAASARAILAAVVEE